MPSLVITRGKLKVRIDYLRVCVESFTQLISNIIELITSDMR